jgi:uncharacterized protein (DUF1697 family)
MPEYVAFLRGVMPTNAKMPALRQCFERAGFTSVRTVLSSGNVIFGARQRSEAAIERQAEAVMAGHLGRTFYTIVRPVGFLRALIETDPYAGFDLPSNAKRIVTFLREPHPPLALPIETDGVRIVATTGREVMTAYLPNPRGPVFMTLIEKTLGADVTTRTWDTVRKCTAARAPRPPE